MRQDQGNRRQVKPPGGNRKRAVVAPIPPGATAGGRRMTSREVAAVAGVSQATVSRVLSGSDLVKESTREAVLRALRETGYVVNASARTMRSGRTGVIGVVVTQVTSPFHVHLLDALSGAIHAASYRMILWDGMRDGEIAAVTALREKAVDSVIFTTASTASDALRDAVGRELPVVLVDRLLPGLRCDGVTSDNLASARNVARYFLETGRTAIAMIGGPPGSSTADERQQGFKSGLTSPAKRKPTLIATADDWVYEEGARAFHEILDHGRVPDAIFCASDVLACGAMDAARAQGLRIPEDLWIAGYDDISVSAWDSYDLTTVRQPLGRMAEQAVRLAVDRLDNPERAPKRSRLASQLVIRGSTARHGSAVASAVS